MSALTSGLPHLDIRSESRSYKRDKTQKVKWTYGARPLNGARIVPDPTLIGASEIQQQKVRPDKRWADRQRQVSYISDAPPHILMIYNSPSKSHRNVTKIDSDAYLMGAATGRIHRKLGALEEISFTNPSLSQSLMDILPVSARAGRDAPVDAGVIYSFDAKTSPHNGIALDGLVEKAERDFLSKEVEKMVRDEYEYLDVSGDSIIVGTGSSGSKKAKRQERKMKEQKPQLLVEEEDDWERV